MTPALTISMPVGPHDGDRRHLLRAVDGVLEQSFRDIRLIVINDGGAPLTEIDGRDDPRIVRFDLPVNRGRYYADAVTLASCSSPWWGPHDSDDWSGPERYRLLMGASKDADAVWSDRWIVGAGGGSRKRAQPKPGEMSGSHAHHAGVYRVEALRHGPHPEFRCSWDSVFVSLVLLYLRWRVVVDQRALYHHMRRADSVTASPGSREGSTLREGAREKYRLLWARCKVTRPDEWATILAPRHDLERSLQADVARLRGNLL